MMKWHTRLFYAFPVQLLVLHLKKNLLLLALWLLLFAIIFRQFGQVMGIPSLFLDPEYMGENSAWALFITGVTLGGFIMAFHISAYIIDGPGFPFLATLKRPFFKFSLNNGILPLSFLLLYGYQMLHFSVVYNGLSWTQALLKPAYLYAGVIAMHLFLFGYFRLTNKDIFRILALRVESRLKKVKLTRVNVMEKYRDRNRKSKVDGYFDESFRYHKIKSVPYYDKALLLKVFDQNHLNSVIIQLVILIVILLTGLLRDHPVFQIPAAASGIMLLTFLLMLSGALIYWFRKWAALVFLTGMIGLNILVKQGILSQPYLAYGLDYEKTPLNYDLPTLSEKHNEERIKEDKKRVEVILHKWKAKQGMDKPPLLIVAGSGGGLRSALWNFHVMQSLDSATEGLFSTRNQLITGSSGGMLGLAYYRELKMQENEGIIPEANDRSWRENIGKDLLNPIIFTLIVNDFFFIRPRFTYNGNRYVKERGYAFEKQLHANTRAVLDKPLQAYHEAEMEATIPMLLMSPSVINDGRKLYISPLSLSFMSHFRQGGLSGGMDFQTLFEDYGAEHLRFSTALRMNATFPIISPNVSLPTRPKMEIMDAGLSDNFGIVDALDFLLHFEDWINTHTSGVILVSIRDTERIKSVSREFQRSLLQKLTVPISVLTNNWSTQQDFRNEDKWRLSKERLKVPMHRVEFQYFDYRENLPPAEFTEEFMAEQQARASLSWHLSPKEKESIYQNLFFDPRNQREILRLKRLLGVAK